jgi:hypothetical protein
VPFRTEPSFTSSRRRQIKVVRTSILLWSVASGAILGLFVDATLIGVALLFDAVVPGIATVRLQHRWVTAVVALLLTLIPLVASLLGYFEGQLKAA